MCRRAAYINGNQVNFGVTVLSGLGGGHIDNLARTTCSKQGLWMSKARGRI